MNPVAWQAIPAGRWEVLENLEKAGEMLRQAEDVVHPLVPEVLMNLAMAIPYPYARTPLDVAAFPGRIGVYMGRLVFKGKPEFGASRHMARLVLAAMSINPDIRLQPTLDIRGRWLGRPRTSGSRSTGVIGVLSLLMLRLGRGGPSPGCLGGPTRASAGCLK